MHARFADSQFGEEMAVAEQLPGGRWAVHRFVPGVGEPPAWLGAGRCTTAGDIVGDAAPDLVCLEAGVHIVEGEIRDGRTGFTWERRHQVASPLDDVIEFRNATGEVATSPPHAEPFQALAVDVDRDGEVELVVSTFAYGAEDPLFDRVSGRWQRRPYLHFGMTFGAVPWLWQEYGEWGVHFMTETAQYVPDYNENSVVVFDGDERTRLYASSRVDDPKGYLGPPEDEHKGSPMGCTWLQLMPASFRRTAVRRARTTPPCSHAPTMSGGRRGRRSGPEYEGPTPPIDASAGVAPRCRSAARRSSTTWS